MVKIVAFIVGSITGAIGWWIGTLFGGFMTAFLVSTVTTGIGMYYGAKYAKENLP